jgi:hypothetical protein
MRWGPAPLLLRKSGQRAEPLAWARDSRTRRICRDGKPQVGGNDGARLGKLAGSPSGEGRLAHRDEARAVSVKAVR